MDYPNDFNLEDIIDTQYYETKRTKASINYYLKLTPEQWKKVQEADEAEVDIEAIKKFIKEVKNIKDGSNS